MSELTVFFFTTMVIRGRVKSDAQKVNSCFFFFNRFSRNRKKRSRSASTRKTKYSPDSWCIIFTANSPGNRQEIHTSVQHS